MATPERVAGAVARAPVLRLGLAMNEKKVRTFCTPQFVSAAKQEGFELVFLDLDKPLPDDLGLDAIVQKITAELVAAPADPSSHARVHHVRDFVARHPDVCMVEGLDKVLVLTSREQVLTLLTPAERALGFGFPATVVVQSQDQLLDLTLPPFPLLCKSCTACGPKSAHRIHVATQPDQLPTVPFPFIAQQFINHNSVLFKIYVLGSEVFVVVRHSLPNISLAQCAEHSMFAFDSQLTAPEVVNDMASHFCLPSQSPRQAQAEEVTQRVMVGSEGPTLSIVSLCSAEHRSMLDLHKLALITHTLSSRMGIGLFGFDLLLGEDGFYNVVDVNYFPGFKGVPDKDGRFCRFVRERVARARHNRA